MKVEMDFKNKECTVSCTDIKEKYYTESAFFYQIKKELQKQGYDIIKKIMSKDGHLIGGDTYPYYIRERSGKWCIWDDIYSIRSCESSFNTHKFVTLRLHELKDGALDEYHANRKRKERQQF